MIGVDHGDQLPVRVVERGVHVAGRSVEVLGPGVMGGAEVGRERLAFDPPPRNLCRSGVVGLALLVGSTQPKIPSRRPQVLR